MKTNVISEITVRLRRANYLYLDGAYELRIDCTVNGQRQYGYSRLMNDDELRSRFDQIFNIAKEHLLHEIKRTNVPDPVTLPSASAPEHG